MSFLTGRRKAQVTGRIVTFSDIHPNISYLRGKSTTVIGRRGAWVLIDVACGILRPQTIKNKEIPFNRLFGKSYFYHEAFISPHPNRDIFF